MRKGKLVSDGWGPSIEGPADEIVSDAWNAKTPAQRVKLARRALEIDLNAIDAYNIIGIHAPTLAEKIALFREADRVGEQLFAPILNDEDMAWWGFIGTRPWMRARHNLGLALAEAQDTDAAIEVFRSLIALNPNDNQGIRYVLLQLFASAGKYGDCDSLFNLYPDDGSIEFPATKLLIELAKARPRKSLGTLLADCELSNSHFLPLVREIAAGGKWPAASSSQYVEFGSKQQAEIYMREFRGAWTRTPRILTNLLAMSSHGKK